MCDVQSVLVFEGLEHYVEPVGGVGLSPFGNKHQVFRVLGMHLRIAFLYVLLEGGVDFDNPTLACLLLKDDEGITSQEVIPGQAKNITNAKPKENAAADQERDSEVPVIGKAVHKGDSLVPFQGFGGSIRTFDAHNLCEFCGFPW